MHENIDFAKVDWFEVLPKLGVPREMLGIKHGPCPIEGEGKTRFRFDNKGGRGTWICNHCGAGDGVRLVALRNGVTDSQAIGLIREVLQFRLPVMVEQRQKPSERIERRTEQQIAKARSRLKKTWEQSKPIQGTPAQAYLLRRVRDLDLRWLSSSFRYHHRLYHFDEETGKTSFQMALLARVTDASAPTSVVTLHRTYLSQAGNKAEVSQGQVKKLMATTIEKIGGESIKLNTASSPWLIVSEGIENGLAWVAASKNKFAAYSAINAGNLAKFKWPEGTKGLLIAGDFDEPNKRTGLRPGSYNADLLRRRAEDAGLRVILKMPPSVGIDWADLWNEGELTLFLSKEERQAKVA